MNAPGALTGAVMRPLADDPCAALRIAGHYSGYLGRLINQSPERLERLAALGPGAMVDAACAQAQSIADGAVEEAGLHLRRAKADVHFACAGADLSGQWPLEGVTMALSRFADVAVRAALRTVAEKFGFAVDTELPGLLVLAMGKLGAFELNYSSDIDLTVFYEPDAFGPEARQRVVRLVQALAKLLEERTAEGYVFRVDLRLRPDPASNPVAVALPAAEHYYQTLGQNWERAAFIKARQIAGDRALGAQFLEALRPFLWRRHLDFAAIADIRSIKRQIAAASGNAQIDAARFDLKRDPGGIRDIELLAQTQQLILGGRQEGLRKSGTCEALLALAQSGAIAPGDADALCDCYRVLRGVEHRLQMLEDEQTHAIPARQDSRDCLAALCGQPDFAHLSAALSAVRKEVVRCDQAVFPASESLADPLGSLSFTGVEDDPETLVTLRRLGFVHPELVTEAIRGWHHGRVRATRSQRARELLTEVTPALLRAFSETGEADAAFQAFHGFFSGLPHGVQALSLFVARPWVMEDLLKACGAAPKLAAQLGARPAALDMLLDWQQRGDNLERSNTCAELQASVCALEDMESALNAVRRVHRDESLRLALLLTAGHLDGTEAGRAYACLADAAIGALLRAVLRDFARRGRAIPDRVAVMGLGKLGGQELASASDLDLMVVYDGEGAGGDSAARLTQALITALSAPTSEGPLYAIDMQLRPSGAKGPIAVRLSSFARYYEKEAWTWELMALTRLRFIAGDVGLASEVMAIAKGALSRPRDGAQHVRDVLDMRARMDRERPPHSVWDLKLAPGALVDVEFAVQARMLKTVRGAALSVRPHLADALAGLAQAEALLAEEAEALHARWRRLTILQQIKRVAWPGPFVPDHAPRRLLVCMAQALGDADFEATARILLEGAQPARALCRKIISESA